MKTTEHETLHPFAVLTPEIAKTMDREGLIDWLCWADPTECYKDQDSMSKFGNTLSESDARYLVLRKLRNIKHENKSN